MRSNLERERRLLRARRERDNLLAKSVAVGLGVGVLALALDLLARYIVN